MPKRSNVKISEKLLKSLEERIRKQVLADIGEIITSKCKEILEKCYNECGDKKGKCHAFLSRSENDLKEAILTQDQEIEFLQNSLAQLQKDYLALLEKHDFVFGSVAFLSEQ